MLEAAVMGLRLDTKVGESKSEDRVAHEQRANAVGQFRLMARNAVPDHQAPVVSDSRHKAIVHEERKEILR